MTLRPNIRATCAFTNWWSNRQSGGPHPQRCNVEARFSPIKNSMRVRTNWPATCPSLAWDQTCLWAFSSNVLLDLAITLLGVLKCGGTCVPLDPQYPGERLAFMLEDAQVSALVTSENLLGKIDRVHAHTVSLDREWNAIRREKNQNPASEAQPETLPTSFTHRARLENLEGCSFRIAGW